MVPCQLKKPFKGPRPRLGSCWRKGREYCFLDKGSLICPKGNSIIFHLFGPLIFKSLRPLWKASSSRAAHSRPQTYTWPEAFVVELSADSNPWSRPRSWISKPPNTSIDSRIFCSHWPDSQPRLIKKKK